MRRAFAVRLQPEAADQLRALDPKVRRQVREKLFWLGDHAEEIHHLPLSRDLSGFCKRRVGNYRIVYQVVMDGRVLVVHRIGHRKDVYDVD